MVFKPFSILNYDTYTQSWSEREFSHYNDWLSFLYSCYKFPGDYKFESTEMWTECATKFTKDKKYTDFNPRSKEYKTFWMLERRKCKQGVIIDDCWISPDYYFFLNFTPIYNKVERKFTFPEIWDGHYHYDMYLQIAYFEDKDGAMAKARQKGISLYHVARITRRLWFYTKANLKILGYEEAYLEGEWGIMSDYRNHLNDNTGWYRNFSPDEKFNWVQQIEVTSGVIEKKTSFKGNKSKVKASLTKRNLAKAVGGASLEIYCTEAGIFRNLKKVKEYVDPNIKMGGVKTGFFCAAGAVGELDDAQDLMEFCFNPKAYNIKPVSDVFSGSEEDIGFFFPDEWNYIYKDEKSGLVVKCYDTNGNSDLSKARDFLDKEEIENKQKDEVSYKLWKSQHPRTLQEAFDQREDNPFPTQQLRELEFKLISQKDIIVKFERDAKGKLAYKFDSGTPVQKLRPKPLDDNRGAVIIKEFPPEKPPFGLFYAGVDPIYNMDTSTSSSLMSITIWIGWHERDNKMCEPYPVATYTGRHKKVADTYEICLALIEFYNARTAVESNVKDFIEWMIKQGKSSYLMRRRELTVISEMMPNSTIRDEIGFRMEGEFKKRCIEKMVSWLTTPVASSFDLETGESHEVYNLTKIWDKMFLKELLKYNPTLNTDRLVSNLGALIACQSDSNRHIIQTVQHNKKNVPVNKVLPSAFRSSVSTSQRRLMPNTFKKR